jgi:hypothetical protein
MTDYASQAEKAKARHLKWRERNREKLRAGQRAKYAADPAPFTASAKKWQEKNREIDLQKRRERANRRYAADPEKLRAMARADYEANKEIRKAAHSKWKRENPHLNREHVRARKAKVMHATPAWASREKILEVYKDAVQLTKETGVDHHVDHIVPLKHDLVCGLHVEFNLRPLPAFDNLSKKNRWWPDMPEAA